MRRLGCTVSRQGAFFEGVWAFGLVLFGMGCERVRACYLRLVGGGWVIF